MKQQSMAGNGIFRRSLVCLIAIVCSGYSLYAQELVAHWSFDEYDADTRTFTDVTGNGFNAAADELTMADGINGKALDCSDTSIDITIPNSVGNFNFGTFTVEGLIYSYVNPVSASSGWDNYKVIFSNHRIGPSGSGITGGYTLEITDGGHLIMGMSNPTQGSWQTCETDQVLLEKQWYHVAEIYDGSYMRLFINGIQVKQAAAADGYLDQSLIPARIGSQFQVVDTVAKTGNVRCHFNGKIDELKIFNYALDAATVAAHFAEYEIPIPPEPEPQLIAHWSFDSSSSNTAFFDVTGNGYDATCSKALATEAGIRGLALKSVETGYGFPIANSVNKLSTPEFTVEVLVKLNNVLGSFHTVFSTQSFPGANDAGYSLEINDQGTVRFAMVATGGTGWTICDAGSVLKNGVWYHLAITFDGGTMKAYVNGVPDGSIERGSGYKVSAKGASIGCQEDASGATRNWFDGQIDELKLYNYALSAETLADNFSSYELPQIPAPEPELIAHWSFDKYNADDKTYTDVTGNGYDAKCSSISVGGGVVGDALDCSGETSEISIPSSAGEFTFDQYTIEGWVYSNIDLNNPGSFYNFKGIFDNARVGMEGSGVTGGYNLQISDKGQVHAGLSVPGGGSWYSCAGTTLLQPRQWYHVAVTFDKSSLRVYLNGKLEKQTAVSGVYLSSGMLPARIASQYQLTDYTTNEGRYRHQFNGKIDELKLYNYPLDGTALLAHYNEIKPVEEPPFEINLGMKTTFAQAGDTVIMPVYIANHEIYSISAVQLALSYNPDQLKLLSMTKDSGVVARWELFDWNGTTAGSVPVAMAGTALNLNYGEGELFRAVFVVSNSVKSNDTCTIGLKDVDIDEKNNLVVSTTQSGRIIIERKSILYGDVTGNNEVNVMDAQTVLKYVVGAINLPDNNCCSNFTVAVADVSGNGTVTSYDAALIFQYSLGLIPSFPVETVSPAPRKMAKRAAVLADKALLSFRLVASTENEQVFDLVGSNLCGFYAGEFSITCKTAGDLISKSVITTNVKGATLSSKFFSTDNLLKVAVSSNDDIDDDEPVTIVRITLPPSGQQSSPEFSVKTALINEGNIVTDYDNTQLTGVSGAQAAGGAAVYCAVRLVNRKLVVSPAGSGIALVTVSNLQGKTVASFTAGGSHGEYDLSRLGKGIYLFRMQAAGQITSGRFMLVDR